ncbi:MAG: Replicative DNA helicase [Candidatus Anoxychlamydiales bacterium]|nr:Replicative DNA helicase [Candidatus Anoxychlamydiales bacterium]
MAKKSIKVKTAPNSKESEMMVLGCSLTSVNSLNTSADNLDDTDFYYTEHKKIFKVLKEAYKKDKPSDIHIVAEELKRQDLLDDIGGVQYLTTLAQFVGTSAYIEEYVQIVKDKSLLRKMLNATDSIEKNVLLEPEDVKNTLDDAQNKFFQISQSVNSHKHLHIKDILSGLKSESGIPYLKELQEKQEKFLQRGPDDSKITGLATHFLDLDKLLNGLSNSNLMILAARPAMGKTALALNIAENICFKNDTSVGMFSLEMTAEQILHRILCSQSEVESEKIKTGSLDGSEYQKIVSCVNAIQKKSFIIDDQPSLKITDLRARARRMKEAFDINFLVIDYLQLLSGSGHLRSLENRQNEVSEISRMLKNLARELNIPILCLSQLSRRVEERQGHRPMMSDLRESGCLSADTQIIDADTGKPYTIKELADRKNQKPINVLGIDSDLKIKKRKMTKVFYSGKKQVFKLTTKSGREIKASANHPFLKLNGWTRLDKLQIGDKISLCRNFNIKQKSNNLSEDELILLAHLLGDGCILPTQPYHYTSNDLENLEYVKKSAKKLFNINGKLVKQKNWYHYYLTSPVHLTHKKYHPITDWFNSLGIKRVRSYEKEIPKKILECDLNSKQLFLKHLWATDGSISIKKIKNRKPSASIYYASSSKPLSHQVQHLLSTTGIQSSLKTVKSSKGYRDMYHIYIQGKPDQEKFLTNIGCIGNRAKKIPTLLNFLSEIKTNPNKDIIPKEAWITVIQEAKEKAQLSWRKICKELKMSYCGSTLFRSGISRERMMRLHNILKDQKTKQLATSDIYWDNIESIEKLQIEDVYDATVEEVHNFVANGIIVHNSLEQDSDLVLFLLRREYYDPYDKPGQAELIIAKNRHGAVGSVNLSFRKEIARFENYTPLHTTEVDHEDSYAEYPPAN